VLQLSGERTSDSLNLISITLQMHYITNLRHDKWVLGCMIVTITILIGFIGLHLVQKNLLPSDFSIAKFKLLLILSTQMMAVILIAVDSKFNWLAIVAGLLVLSGAIIGSLAVK